MSRFRLLELLPLCRALGGAAAGSFLAPAVALMSSAYSQRLTVSACRNRLVLLSPHLSMLVALHHTPMTELHLGLLHLFPFAFSCSSIYVDLRVFLHLGVCCIG